MTPAPALTPAALPNRQRLEYRLLLACALLFALALTAPALPQPASYHAFADPRSLAGLPFAADVLSNLPFALWGLAGIALAWPFARGGKHRLAHQREEGRLALLFFAGLVATAVGSSWYHLRPDDGGLLLDRCGMVVAFAGLLGLAGAGRVSLRAGRALAAAMLLAGPLAALWCAANGNVVPWLVVQFGGMALVVWFACLERRPGTLEPRWGLVIAIYAAAKLFELGDHAIWELSGGWVSGHSLKHLAAAFAAWPVAAALLRSAGTPSAPRRKSRAESA